MENENTQRDVSFYELASLHAEFEFQLRSLGVEFVNYENRMECLYDFVGQYIDGNDEPSIWIPDPDMVRPI